MPPTLDARRIVIRPDGRAETEEFAAPSPGAGQVLIRAEYTAVSAGTELGSQEQRRAGDYYPGYSSVGVVVECGAGVDSAEPGARSLRRRPREPLRLVRKFTVLRARSGRRLLA